MSYQNVFKRYEIKYLITKMQQQIIMEAAAPFIKSDEYGKSTICNIYFDTPDYILARRSLEKPIYKEKLRVRSYGGATPDSTVFVELKKKYDDVVYKRRFNLKEKSAMEYLCSDVPMSYTSQIINEIDYFRHIYQTLTPTVFLSYDREAYCSKEDDNFRITFDENILWRDHELSLCSEVYGKPLLNDNEVLMELKVTSAIPLWMTGLLNKNSIFKTSFSKYGSAYKYMFYSKTLGGKRYA